MSLRGLFENNITFRINMKQEARGPHRSREKPVPITKHICVKLWLYHIPVREEKNIISFFINDWSLVVKFLSHSPKNALCQVWLTLAHLFWRKRFLNFVNVFLPSPYYLPLEKGVVLHINKFESPSHKDDLCQVWQKLANWTFKFRQCIFTISELSPIGKRHCPSC